MKVRDILIVFNSLGNKPTNVYFSNAEVEMKDDALFVKKETTGGVVSAMYPLSDILKFTVNTETINGEALSCLKSTKK